MRRLKFVVTRTLEIVVAALVAVLVSIVLWGVFSRFVISIPSPWTEEVATHLLAWVALLGAAVGFSQKQHLGVDVVSSQLQPDAQRTLACIVQVLVILFALCVMVWGGSTLVWKTLAIGQVTPTLNMPMGYVYLSVPVSGLFIMLFSIEQLCEIWNDSDQASGASEELARKTEVNQPHV